MRKVDDSPNGFLSPFPSQPNIYNSTVRLIMHSVWMRSTEHHLESGRSARIGYCAFATRRERCPWFAGTGPLKNPNVQGRKKKNSKPD